MGEYEKALSDFQNARELSFDDAIHLVEQAVALHALERHKEAVQKWREAAALRSAAMTAESLQDEYQWANPFYEALQALEKLAEEDAS